MSKETRELHILFTGVGRRIELIQAFRQAAQALDIRLKIYGADMAGTAPALAYCDHTRKVCAMKDPAYIDELVRICAEDTIDLLIPTIDTDLVVLSRNKDRFETTRVLISPAESVAICRDKNFTADFFESCGCFAPRTVNDWTKYAGGYPCFIKPKDGSSSINAFKAENAEELQVYAEQIGDYVVQPFIEGTEYTVDVCCDFEGNPIYITPRIRLQIREGEVLKTQTALDAQIIEECRRIIGKFRPVGPITIQLIRQKATGKDYFIEINPRYGGGAPLSMKAGARSPEALLRLLLGEKLEYTENTDNGAIFSRFDQSVCIREGERKQPIKGVIFDLDDTLYSEKAYVRSGFAAVAAYLAETDEERERIQNKLWNCFEAGKPAIDACLEEIGRIEEKAECLKIYRGHPPTIELYEGAEAKIEELKAKGIKIGILTDGRPEGQRAKIKALGLEALADDIIITDELGGVQFRKPNDIAFRILQCRWKVPYEQIIYVADNPEKDFQAPRQLGMRSLWLKNPDGIYAEHYDTFEEQNMTVIYSLAEVTV